MAGCAWSSGSGLHGSGQLVEAQVVGSADLEGLAAGRRVGDGPLDEGGHVGDRDEVDGVVAVAEHDRTAGPPGGLLSRSTHSSTNAVARTTVVGTPLAGRTPRRRASCGTAPSGCPPRHRLSTSAPSRRWRPWQRRSGWRCRPDRPSPARSRPVRRSPAPPTPRPQRPRWPGRGWRGRASPTITSTWPVAKCAARSGSRLRTRTSNSLLTRRPTTTEPSRPVPPATRITAGRRGGPAGERRH